MSGLESLFPSRDRLAQALPWWARRCCCRSYHERTGEHVRGCPRRRPDALASLRLIEETARWYADNPQRLAHEVDHALCVEVLGYALDGLE